MIAQTKGKLTDYIFNEVQNNYVRISNKLYWRLFNRNSNARIWLRENVSIVIPIWKR